MGKNHEIRYKADESLKLALDEIRKRFFNQYSKNGFLEMMSWDWINSFRLKLHKFNKLEMSDQEIKQELRK